MFGYCLGNPAMLADSDGLRSVFIDTTMHDNSMSPQQLASPVKRTAVKIKRRIYTEKKKAEARPDCTLTRGWTASAFFGGGVSGSVGITCDFKGNIGIICSANSGGGFPNASIGSYYSMNNAPTIYKQAGLGVTVGGSAGPVACSVGAEYNILIDVENDTVYHGGTFSGSVGPIPACVELHGEVGNSWVWGINIYDVAIQIFE